MKKNIILIFIALFAITLTACTENPFDGIIEYRQEAIERREWPEESEIMRDARFLRRRLPLKDIEIALEIAAVLYTYNIVGLRRTTIANRIKDDFEPNLTHFTFKITDQYGDIFYIGLNGRGFISSIWRLEEHGVMVELLSPFSRLGE